MANIIDTDTKDAILTGIDRYMRAKGASMTIYQIESFRTLREHTPAQFGVNWAACGTQAPAETKQFAEHLMEAAHICEVLNGYQWVETGGDAVYETAEDYHKDVNHIYEGLTGGNDIKKLVDMIV